MGITWSDKARSRLCHAWGSPSRFSWSTCLLDGVVGTAEQDKMRTAVAAAVRNCMMKVRVKEKHRREHGNRLEKCRLITCIYINFRGPSGTRTNITINPLWLTESTTVNHISLISAVVDYLCMYRVQQGDDVLEAIFTPDYLPK